MPPARVLYDIVNGLLKCDEQGHIAGDDLGQHAHGGACLRLSAFVGEQAAQNFLSNCLLSGIRRAVNTALGDASQTVSESVLIAWWAGFGAYACHSFECSA